MDRRGYARMDLTGGNEGNGGMNHDRRERRIKIRSTIRITREGMGEREGGVRVRVRAGG